jgi:N-acetylated-alpha-linked acidic dipeptidase
MTMKFVYLASAACICLAAPALAAPAETQALEKNFDALITPTDQQQWLQQMASEPIHVGSPHDKANAEMELALFKQWGWDSHIEQFDVLYPPPISTTLELVTPERVTLGGQEPPIPEDPSLTPENLAKALPH